MNSREGKIFTCCFSGNWADDLHRLLDRTALLEALRKESRVILKPNLVKVVPPPMTTPVALTAALVDWLQEKAPHLDIVVADGTGSLTYDTFHVFDELGYSRMAQEKGIRLIDLNEEPSMHLKKPGLTKWPEMFLPQIVFNSYLISLPVLKAHSLAGVTLTMKNMMGLCPPSHYHKGGQWKKAAFHEQIDEAIADLNRYRTADFTLLDATVGMQEAHLWGPTCDPPPRILAASFDPVAIDAYGCGLLKRDWTAVGHIRMTHGELGLAAPLQIEARGKI